MSFVYVGVLATTNLRGSQSFQAQLLADAQKDVKTKNVERMSLRRGEDESQLFFRRRLQG